MTSGFNNYTTNPSGKEKNLPPEFVLKILQKCCGCSTSNI